MMLWKQQLKRQSICCVVNQRTKLSSSVSPCDLLPMNGLITQLQLSLGRLQVWKMSVASYETSTAYFIVGLGKRQPERAEKMPNRVGGISTMSTIYRIFYGLSWPLCFLT